MPHFARPALLVPLLLALLLAGALPLFPAGPAHAQGTGAPTVTITTDQASVYEGGLALFTLTRQGDDANPLTVRVSSWEPNHETSAGVNPTQQYHDVEFAGGSAEATLSVLSYIDTREETGTLELKAQVLPATDGSYQVGSPDTASVEALDLQGGPPPAGHTAVSVRYTSFEVNEVLRYGYIAISVDRQGNLSQPTNVLLRIDDPQNVLRGNHWNQPVSLPRSLHISRHRTGSNLLVTIPDDQRYVENGSFRMVLLPSTNYLLSGDGEVGFEPSTEITVLQNELPQELELNFGKDGVNGASIFEGDPLKFVVKRRQQDANIGSNATFVVRVETDRGGTDAFLDDWTEDTSTGRLFKDYPLRLTGNDTEIEQVIPVAENEESEGDWSYWASIKTLEDWEGVPLTDAEEAEYWTVPQGFRETRIDAIDSESPQGLVTVRASQTEVYEGEEAVFTVSRSGGPMSVSLTVGLDSWEPNRQPASGANPSAQSHLVTFAPLETEVTLPVATFVDRLTEDSDSVLVTVSNVGRGYNIGDPFHASVHINDPPAGTPIISIAPIDPSVAEGNEVIFVVTRRGDRSNGITVNFEYDDPGGLLRGNHWDPAPELPTEIVLNPNIGEVALRLMVPDDQRDVDGQSFTVSVLPSDE